jgi:hypothetical protein
VREWRLLEKGSTPWSYLHRLVLHPFRNTIAITFPPLLAVLLRMGNPEAVRVHRTPAQFPYSKALQSISAISRPGFATSLISLTIQQRRAQALRQVVSRAGLNRPNGQVSSSVWVVCLIGWTAGK